jgi:hypothetical protein
MPRSGVTFSPVAAAVVVVVAEMAPPAEVMLGLALVQECPPLFKIWIVSHITSSQEILVPVWTSTLDWTWVAVVPWVGSLGPSDAQRAH